MKLFSQLKTSEKLSLSFSLMSVAMLLIYSASYVVLSHFFENTEIITLMSLGIIIIFSSLQFFLGTMLSSCMLKDLKNIARDLQDISLEGQKKHNIAHLPKNDEIRILAEALNTSYDDLEKETKKLKQFLSDVSHEFKTPLMVMNSRLDVLEKKYEQSLYNKTDQEAFFILTRRNIAKLNHLIETLFLLSRCDELHGDCLIRKRIDMNAYFGDIQRELYNNFPDVQLDIELDIEKNLFYMIDETSFSILLNNIVENAIKFSIGDIKLCIRADSKGFSIEDNGPGIAMEEQEKIFEKFYRKDTSKEGFGVGLSLVKRISELYNWKLECRSTPEKGTTFYFIF